MVVQQFQLSAANLPSVFCLKIIMLERTDFFLFPFSFSSHGSSPQLHPGFSLFNPHLAGFSLVNPHLAGISLANLHPVGFSLVNLHLACLSFVNLYIGGSFSVGAGFNSGTGFPFTRKARSCCTKRSTTLTRRKMPCGSKTTSRILPG